MKTKKLTSYRQFIAADRPYLPRILNHVLLLPNFATNPDNSTVHHVRRLVISSGVVYNHGQLCAVWVCCTSCQGFRWRYLYFKSGLRITWHNLTWDQKRAVAAAYASRREQIPMMYAPVKRIERWL